MLLVWWGEGDGEKHLRGERIVQLCVALAQRRQERAGACGGRQVEGQGQVFCGVT